jgi:hypothetical protein
MIGDRKPDNTYGNYYTEGCAPNPPNVAVAAVEDELERLFERYALGTPLEDNKTVKSVMVALTSNQGEFLRGKERESLDMIVRKILAMMKSRGVAGARHKALIALPLTLNLFRKAAAFPTMNNTARTTTAGAAADNGILSLLRSHSKADVVTTVSVTSVASSPRLSPRSFDVALQETRGRLQAVEDELLTLQDESTDAKNKLEELKASLERYKKFSKRMKDKITAVKQRAQKKAAELDAEKDLKQKAGSELMAVRGRVDEVKFEILKEQQKNFLLSVSVVQIKGSCQQLENKIAMEEGKQKELNDEIKSVQEQLTLLRKS